MNLYDELEKLGAQPEDLDDIVVVTALDIASEANIGGLPEQVEFLKILGGYSDEEILGMVKESLGKDEIEVEWDDHLNEDAEFGPHE